MRRRQKVVEQQMAPVKHVETTIVSIETVEEDDETIKLRFFFYNKTKFTKKLKKEAGNIINGARNKKEIQFY